MQRISVVGTCGTGKSTLAFAAARRLNIPCTELDSLVWGPNWSPAPPDVLQRRVDAATAGETWIIEGGYAPARDAIWKRADTIIWLDYSLPVILRRLACRSIRRIVRREVLWNGNRETLAMALSRDSILLWASQSYQRKRREIPELLARPEYAHLQLIRFRSPRQAAK